VAIEGGMIDRAIKARRQQPGYQDFSLKPLGDRIRGFMSGLFGEGYNRPIYSGSLGIKPPEAVEPAAATPPAAVPPSGLDLSRPKPFAMTPEGQFDRYFKTPEFDYVFGAGSRGKGAPADAAAMEVLGNQLMAPEKDTNVASMYAAQSAMGRVNQAAIQEMYKDRPDLQKWAAANPMLAQREFLKSEQRRASEMPTAPDQETVMGDLGSRAQDEGGYSLEAYGLPVREKVAKFLGKK